MSPRTLLVALLLLPVACVSQGPESQLGRQEREMQEQRLELTRTNDCVFQSTISDFKALNDRYLVLFASGRRRAYLADLSGACFDLDSQVSLAAVDGDGNGQICGYGRDSVAFRGMGKVESCRILGLEQLSDERRLELGLEEQPKPKEADGEQPVAPE